MINILHVVVDIIEDLLTYSWVINRSKYECGTHEHTSREQNKPEWFFLIVPGLSAWKELFSVKQKLPISNKLPLYACGQNYQFWAGFALVS